MNGMLFMDGFELLHENVKAEGLFSTVQCKKEDRTSEI